MSTVSDGQPSLESLQCNAELLRFIVDRVDVGIFVIDSALEVKLWNKFMVTHSGKKSDEVVGHNKRRWSLYLC